VKRLMSNNKILFAGLVMLAIVFLLSAVPSMAQEKEIPPMKVSRPVLSAAGSKEEAKDPGKWKYEIILGGPIATMDATLTVGDKTTQKIVKPSEIIDKIEFAFEGRFQARRDRWGFFTDLMLLRLKDNMSFNRVSGTAKMNSTIWQLAGTYRISEGDTDVDVLAGFRYNAIDVDVNLLPLAKVSKRASWVDPIIGAKARMPLSKNLDFNLYGDIGGFGVGSQFTWRGSGYLDWQLSKTFSLIGGYSIYDVDYKKGSGLDEFRYDTTMKGPVLGASFKF